MPAMYINFDLNCKIISIARAKFNVVKSNILAIQPRCPRAIGAKNASYVQYATVHANITALGGSQWSGYSDCFVQKPTSLVYGALSVSGTPFPIINSSVTKGSGVSPDNSYVQSRQYHHDHELEGYCHVLSC